MEENYIDEEAQALPIPIEFTQRGWPLGKFTDRYGAGCSIQDSSLATEDCIWLGVDDADPKVMASKAAWVGVQTNETTGWVPYPVPAEVSLNTRMHLTRGMAVSLIEVLKRFVENGTIR
jgi:hypothetical protein